MMPLPDDQVDGRLCFPETPRTYSLIFSGVAGVRYLILATTQGVGFGASVRYDSAGSFAQTLAPVVTLLIPKP